MTVNERIREAWQFASASFAGTAGVDGPFLPLFAGGAAVALGNAVQIANGALAPEAIHDVTLALLALGLAFFAPRPTRARRWVWHATALVLAAGVVFQIALMLGTPPGIYLRTPFWADAKVRVALGLATLLVGLGVTAGPRTRTPILLALGAIHATLALWTLEASPQPAIDVFVWHGEAFRALAAHRDPYAISIPNIYGSGQFYGPGLVVGNRVLVGYPYPPLSLIFGWLGHLAGDYRLANVAATTGAGLLMASTGRSPTAVLGASIFWFSPRILFVHEQGWTDPQVVLGVAAVVFCASRAPRLAPWALGLAFALKQYAVLLAPLVLLIAPPPRWRTSAIWVAKAACLAAVTVIPFLIWSPKDFFDSVVAFQVRQPFRPDALSYLAAYPEMRAGWVNGGNFVALVPALVIALVRAPRTPAGFALGSGLLLVAFFAFAKQAFCNYYMCTIGVLCCAVASATDAPRRAHG